MTRTVDFDAFRAEQKHEPVILHIGGEDYELPPSMPASVAVDLIHLKKRFNDDDDVPLDVLDSFGKSIFGDHVWEDLITKHRLLTDEIGELLQMVLAMYSPKEEKADPQKASTPRTRKSSSRS